MRILCEICGQKLRCDGTCSWRWLCAWDVVARASDISDRGLCLLLYILSMFSFDYYFIVWLLLLTAFLRCCFLLNASVATMTGVTADWLFGYFSQRGGLWLIPHLLCGNMCLVFNLLFDMGYLIFFFYILIFFGVLMYDICF